MGDKPEKNATKTDTDSTDWPAEVEKWKALARKHEEQSKQNHEELSKLKSASDASKSDMDKVLEQLAVLEKRASEAETKAMIAEVAAEEKLTATQAARLRGATREELLADAKELRAAFAPVESDKDDKDADGSDKDGRRPKENLRGGATSTDDDETVDYAKLADSIASRSSF